MKKRQSFIESIEESFMAIAYAEAADYRDFLNVLRYENERLAEFAHPDECQYGDNDLCYLES